MPIPNAIARIRNSRWDFFFLDMAEHVSTMSKDPSTKCGAVIVRPDRTVASLGFNGFPMGCSDDPKFYEDREMKLSRVVHAELNAILHAREPLHGYTIFTFPPGISGSCDRCTAHIIQSGIKTLVHIYDDKSEFSARWADAAERANQMYDEAGIEQVHYPLEVWQNE